jgi:hypothetical protein
VIGRSPDCSSPVALALPPDIVEFVPTVAVSVQKDHLDRLAKTRAESALVELIWNGLDAEANTVDVTWSFTALGAIDQIAVEDTGHGMSASEAEEVFARLGGSWKNNSKKTRNGKRELHGSRGEGRFRAYALGDYLYWTTYNGAGEKTEIEGSSAKPDEFNISEPQADAHDAGTVVRISGVAKVAERLTVPAAIDKITTLLALYLAAYPDVTVRVGGTQIDPVAAQVLSTDYDLAVESEGSGEIAALLTVIEWKQPQGRALLLCSPDGFALHELAPGIQAPDFNFTAYLRSDLFTDETVRDLEMADWDPRVSALLDAAKEQLRTHFRERASERTREVVEQWKEDDIYPFEGDAANSIEQAERQVFDIVALNVNAYSTGFARSEPASKKLQLELLRIAIESNPSAMRTILEELISLPEDRQDELAGLIDRGVELSAIVSAAKSVTSRLDFLRGLEALVFDVGTRKEMTEPDQLHRLVAQHTWIFGEGYALTVDEEGLRQVLRRHLKAQGRDDVDIAEEARAGVVREDGRGGRVDLMLSRLVPHPHGGREHLVVELKRPSVSLGLEQISQVESYALAVASDDRFRDTDTAWEFWLVGNDLTDGARAKVESGDRPPGLVMYSSPLRIRLWVKTWGQIIEAARTRHEFLEKELSYASSRELGLGYLQREFDEFLPESVRARGIAEIAEDVGLAHVGEHTQRDSD